MREHVDGRRDRPGPGRRGAEIGRVETRTVGSIPVGLGETVLRL